MMLRVTVIENMMAVLTYAFLNYATMMMMMAVLNYAFPQNLHYNPDYANYALLHLTYLLTLSEVQLMAILLDQYRVIHHWSRFNFNDQVKTVERIRTVKFPATVKGFTFKLNLNLNVNLNLNLNVRNLNDDDYLNLNLNVRNLNDDDYEQVIFGPIINDQNQYQTYHSIPHCSNLIYQMAPTDRHRVI